MQKKTARDGRITAEQIMDHFCEKLDPAQYAGLVFQAHTKKPEGQVGIRKQGTILSIWISALCSFWYSPESRLIKVISTDWCGFSFLLFRLLYFALACVFVSHAPSIAHVAGISQGPYDRIETLPDFPMRWTLHKSVHLLLFRPHPHR